MAPQASFVTLNLSRGLTEDRDIETYGGVSIAQDVDLKTKIGSVLARKVDALSIESPNNPYNTVHEIVAREQFGEDDNTYGILTRPSSDESLNINGFGVRGFKKFNGDDVSDGSPDQNGWLFHPDAQAPVLHGNLDHNGREIRFHSENPKWYGTANLTEETEDFPFTNPPDGDVEHSRTKIVLASHAFLIDSPFGADNIIAPPSNSLAAPDIDIEIVEYQGRNVTFADIPMWGPRADGTGRFEFAYFAAAFVYDGTQESPLVLLKAFQFPTDEAWRAIGFDFTYKCVRYGGGGLRAISKRVRKIRIYCAPSDVKLSDPKAQGKFYLANELDVEKWDKNSPVRYDFPAERVEETYDGEDRVAVRIETDTGFCRTDLADGGSPEVYPEFQEGSPVFRIGDDETDFYPSAVVVNPSNGSHINHRSIDFFLPLDAYTSFDGVFESSPSKRIRVYHSFRLGQSPVHRVYIGNELTSRSTYKQLSGLSPTVKVVSPPRRLGYSGYDIPVICGVKDEDGVWHENRGMWACYSTSSVLTPDRFLNSRDFSFDLIGVARSGSYLAWFGRTGISFGILRRDDLEWEFIDAYSNIGCVSRRSIVETPDGVMFLSQGGIRMLRGIEVSDVLSMPIRDSLEALKDHWSSARASYSARHRKYYLHFPSSGVTPYKCFAYDFDIQQWTTHLLNNGEERAYAGATDPDGDAIFSFEELNGLYKMESGVTQSPNAEYELSDTFGDHVHEKVGQRMKIMFDGLAISQPMTLRVTTDGGVKTGDARANDFSTNPVSNVPTNSISMTARKFKFKFSNFLRLGGAFVEVENTERV